MPIKQAAAKAWRQTKRQTLRHLQIKTTLDLWERNLTKAVLAKQPDEIKKLVVSFQQALDKAAQRRVISKNKAARLKSRAMKKMTV